MLNHVRVYLDHFGYDGYSYMPCEVCTAPANQVHHIVYRSKFGKKTKDQQDKIENLMGLCFSCHEKAHNEIYTQEYLQELHNAFMGK